MALPDVHTGEVWSLAGFERVLVGVDEGASLAPIVLVAPVAGWASVLAVSRAADNEIPPRVEYQAIEEAQDLLPVFQNRY